MFQQQTFFIISLIVDSEKMKVTEKRTDSNWVTEIAVNLTLR